MRQLLRFVDGVSTVCAWAASALAFVLIVVTLIEVFMRFVVGSPTIWVFDVAYMVSGASVLLAAGYALRTDAHVRIDFLSSRLPVRVQALVQGLFFALVILPALFMIGRAAYGKAWSAFSSGEVEGVSPWAPLIWPFYAALTFGLTVLALQVVAQTIRLLDRALRPEHAQQSPGLR